MGGPLSMSESTPLRDSVQGLPASTFGGEPRAPSQILVGDLGQHYGLRWFHMKLLVCVCLVMTPGWSIVSTSPFVLDDIRQEFGVSNSAASLVATAILFGSFVGVPLSGFMGDKFGRRATLAACIMGIVTGNLFHFMIPRAVQDGGHSSGFAVLIALRLLLGIPYGGFLTLMVPYVVELWPDDSRGAAAVATNLSVQFAQFYCISCVRYVESFALDWRAISAIVPLLPFVLSLACLAWMTESPRWLLIMGRKDEAQRVLDGVFESSSLHGSAYVGKAPDVLAQPTHRMSMKSSAWLMETLSDMCSPDLLPATIVAGVLYTILAGAGNATWTWGPEFMEGMMGYKVNLLVFQLSEAVGILGTCFSMVGIDKLGRRFLLVVGFGTQAIVFCVYLTGMTGGGAILLWIIRGFGDAILWATLPLYISEIFPTAIRATAVSLTMILGRIASLIYPMFIGVFIDVRIYLVCIIFMISFGFGVVFSLMIPQEPARLPTSDDMPRTPQATSCKA